MRHELILPDDFKRKAELHQFLDKVLNVVTLDIVFLSQEQGEGELAYHVVTLIVDASLDYVLEPIQSLIQVMAEGHPYFKIRLYAEAQLVAGLERGGLFFLEHCCFGTDVYSTPLAE